MPDHILSGAEVALAPVAADRIEVSVVIPALNEADNLPTLIGEVVAALEGRYRYEVVVVDDGSTDGTPAVLASLKAGNCHIVSLRHRQPCGQSAAMLSGIRRARGMIAVTLDGDGQNDPADIPRLVETLQHAGQQIGLVAGRRKRRQDSFVKRLSSRFANGLRRRLLGDGVADTGCGIRAVWRNLYLELPYFDHMHRFLPALVQREGRDVVSVDVNHRPRSHGRSKYGTIDRALAGILDLAGVMWLQHRRNRARLYAEPDMDSRF
jgi:dolichol-phosphate mannosyltransferase